MLKKRSPLLLILLFVFLTPTMSLGQISDCVGAIPVCGNGDLELLPTGSGANDFANPNNNPPTCGFTESKSLWLKIKIKQAGSLGFVITPVNNNCPSGLCDDYDFAVYGPNVDCNNLGSSLRCQSTHPPSAGVGGETGMTESGTGSDGGPGAAGNGFVHWLDLVNVGESYYILIDNFDQRAGFSLAWTGTALLEDRITKEEGGVDLGDDVVECANIAVTLDATQVDGGQYVWQDGSTDPTFTVMPGNSGTYSVEVVNSSGCRSTDEIEVTFSAIPEANNQSDSKCESSAGSGTADFDLTDYSTGITGGVSGVNITYHENLADADSGSNPVSSTQTVGSRSFFARVEDNTDVCYETAEIMLVVNTRPTINNAVLPIVTCVASPNANIDLSLADNQVSDGASGVTVSYHISVADATAGINPLPNPYNTSSTTLFTRVSDDSTGCFDTSTIDIIVDRQPEIRPQSIPLCSDDSTASFDLLTVEEDIVNGAVNVSVSFHASQADADAGTPSLPTNFTTESTTIYARSTAVYEGRTCYSISLVTLTVNPNPETATAGIISCSTTADGIFNLGGLADEVSLSIPNRVVSFHPTMQDAIDDRNEFDSPHSTVSSAAFARVENTITNCFSIEIVNFEVQQYEELDIRIQLIECLQNRLATFNLSEAKRDLEREWGNRFTFYPTAIDAENGRNALTAPIISNTGSRIFARIDIGTTGCFQIEPAQLVIEEVPELEETAFFCLGDTYTLPSGLTVSDAGVYPEYIQDPITGCDILITTTLYEAVIEFASAFSPNGNTANDAFGALPGQACAPYVDEFSLQVFNRWGELVFETTSYDEHWDGIFNGQPAGFIEIIRETAYILANKEFELVLSWIRLSP